MKLYKKVQSISCVASACAMLLATAFVQPANATEGGGSQYGHGSEGFLDAFPPGLHLVNYTTYYTAGKSMNNDGNNSLPNFKVRAVADIFRVMHTTRDLELFGSKISSHILIPFVSAYANLGFQGPPGMITSNSRNGIGDITIAPVMLGWHSKNYHLITGVDITIPTGAYNKNDVANPGRNYWGIQPNFIVSYTGDMGFMAFGKFMYDFNTKNNDTGYQSGQEFHIDYGISQGIKLFEQDFMVGVGGYIYQQTTKDKVDSNYAGAVNENGRVFAAGPQIEYKFKNMSFDLKYQKEFEARNRSEGDKFWFKVNYSF